MGRSLLKVLLLAAVVVLPVEAVSGVAVLMLQRAGLIWTPPDLEGYDRFLASRDPLLGWPDPAASSEGELASDGTRRDPGFPEPEEAPACVAVFGDSFTWGDEVGAGESYPAALGRSLGCRVANFGVPGYGTDQALLRYRDRVRSDAPVVVLGHYSGDIIRNVNRYRGFLTNTGFGMKPRFRIGSEGELELIPPADLSARQMRELGEHPEWLPHEFFFPGGEAGIVRRKLPFTATAISVLGHYRLQARLNGVPSYQAFYAPDHPSRALEVTAGIARAFAQTARARGQHPILVLVPDEKDLIQAQSGLPLPYEPLIERAEAAGIEVVDGARAALAALDGRAPCALYTRCGGAHFNPEGYAVLAQGLRSPIEGVLPIDAPDRRDATL